MVCMPLELGTLSWNESGTCVLILGYPQSCGDIFVDLPHVSDIAVRNHRTFPRSSPSLLPTPGHCSSHARSGAYVTERPMAQALRKAHRVAQHRLICIAAKPWSVRYERVAGKCENIR